MLDARELVEKNANDPSVYRALEDILLNSSMQYSLPERFRALFSLKNLGTEEAVQVISKAFIDNSALLKHELAYVLGQMGYPSALHILEQVLRDTNQEAMAAEAMGAIGDESSISVLQEYVNDPEDAVRETCLLALEKFRNKATETRHDSSVYRSVDPAPAFDAVLSISELRLILLDEKKPLYERYQAMFSLRNDGSVEAVEALADGLRLGKSALFRHEVAFVFGQMQHPASVGVLKEVLARPDEIDMVRHECAEALGSIATGECLPELQKYLGGSENADIPVVVKESCEVALDMYAHENDVDSFHYAALPGQ